MFVSSFCLQFVRSVLNVNFLTKEILFFFTKIKMNKAVYFLIFFQCLCLMQPKDALFVNKKSLSENIQSGLIFAGKIFGELTTYNYNLL